MKKSFLIIIIFVCIVGLPGTGCDEMDQQALSEDIDIHDLVGETEETGYTEWTNAVGVGDDSDSADTDGGCGCHTIGDRLTTNGVIRLLASM